MNFNTNEYYRILVRFMFSHTHHHDNLWCSVRNMLQSNHHHRNASPCFHLMYLMKYLWQ